MVQMIIKKAFQQPDVRVGLKGPLQSRVKRANVSRTKRAILGRIKKANGF